MNRPPVTSLRALLSSGVLSLGLALSLTVSLSAQAQVAPHRTHSHPVAPSPSASPLVSSAKVTAAPTPERLAEIYDDVWFKLGETYIDTTRLDNWGEWRHKYDGKLKNEQDLDAAVNAMASSLGDYWTGYESSHQRLLEVFASVRGLVDLGVDLKVDNEGNQIIRIAPFGGLARDNGLQAGDTLISINGKNLKGHTVTEVQELLRLPLLSTVKIVYQTARNGAADQEFDATKSGDTHQTLPSATPPLLAQSLHTVTFTAKPSTAPLAEAKMLDNGIMYARLSSFRDGPLDIGVLNNSVTKLLAECQCHPRGLVLDLRGNPGGSFELVLKEAAFFLPGKTIVSSTTREGNLITFSSYKAQALTSFESAGLSDPQRQMIDVFTNSPMVVLVDASTASAAELITGALKDNDRALVVGVRTYGKGVGFDEIDLPLGGQLTVTKLKYATPSGFDVSSGGIEPDLYVVQPRDSEAVGVAADGAHSMQTQPVDVQLAAGLQALEARIKLLSHK